ncbi:MAG TPA: hypothetical protein VK034_29470 [Enhygromyxa sp.]|nr:hypothetical protein [Enhygromyxa sp.]
MLTLAGCGPAPVSDAFTTNFGEMGGDGDGGSETGDGDGDGDGDGEPGDGDGEPGDGDGDQPDPTCDDGVQNQDETDVDCGGDNCSKCDEGKGCSEASDCTSNMCIGQLCVTGCLGDVECDYLDDGCMQGICNIGKCEQHPLPPGSSCTTGEICKQDGECVQGECIEQDLDCTEFDSGCTLGSCDLETGECVLNIVNEGMPCDDAEGCAIAPYCISGECLDPDGGALFYEPFANNDAGWTLGPNWQIGPAAAGCGNPGTDHSPTADNGVAGVLPGACLPDVLHSYYCLTSPPIDTTALPAVWMTYYRELDSDYTPYMKNVLEVYNGNSWVILFETFGPPGVADANWTYFSYDVSAYSNANMQFRWCYNITSNFILSVGGWTVDDFTVSAAECNGGDL